MKISPCKDCSRRTPGCHQDCPDYRQWRGGVDDYYAWKKRRGIIYAYDKETQKRLQVRRKHYMSNPRGTDE